MVMEVGEKIPDALGEGGQASLHSATPGDLRTAQIAGGVTALGVSVELPAAAPGFQNGFHAQVAALNIQEGMARSPDWKPTVDADGPQAQQQAQTFDPNTLG